MADFNQELNESIAYFEQILSVLPGDRTALEFLCLVFSQSGDVEKFIEYAKALADVLVRERDADGAASLIVKLSELEDSRAKALVLKLKVLSEPEIPLTPDHSVPKITSMSSEVAVAAEKTLVERLAEDGFVNGPTRDMVVEQLDNSLGVGGNFLTSALSILEKENLTGFAEVLAAVADIAHAPPVPLESFEIQPSFVNDLPEALVKVRGIVPFAKLGGEWAVASLNPLDDVLRQEVSESMNAKCHFFAAFPSAVEKVLEGLYATESGKRGDAEQADEVQPADEPPPMADPFAASASVPVGGAIK